MRNTLAAFGLAAAASVASAQLVSPYTETFDIDASGWLSGSFTPLVHDASGFVSTTADISAAGPFGLTLFRGHDDFNASGDAFVGDYLASGITSISIDIRHDYTASDLDFALRVATSANSPGFAIVASQAVGAGGWTTLTFDLDWTSPLYIPEGAPDFAFFQSVMENVGNLQVSITPPAGLPTGTFVTFDLDNVSTIPAPSGLALLGLGGLAATRRRR